MLTHLALKNFVIVDELAIDLNDGLTVLTGETGAGKSILLDALQFIMGARADTDVIRENESSCDLTAIFEVNDGVVEQLQELGLASEDLLDRSLIMRRVIDRNGRSRAWINGVAATAGQLRQVGQWLLDIHGQHAHQSLLKPSSQLALVDAFGNHPQALQDVKNAFNAWKKAQNALTEAKANLELRRDEAERLAWVNDELSQIAPMQGEWETINAEHKRLGNAADIVEGLRETIEALDAGERSAIGAIGRAASRLEHLAHYDEKLEPFAEQLLELQSVAEDVLREIERYLDKTDLDEHHFEEVDRRVSLYFNAARKFHVLPETLYEKWEQTQARLQELEKAIDIDQLVEEEKAARKHYQRVAAQLSALRRTSSQTLSDAVTASMQQLAMTGGRFDVAWIEEKDPTSHGAEHCEFLVAGHAGVTPRELTKVASGGELSRISLAIAVITSAQTPVDTLIFDEVDAGIGGAVAETVGKLLQQLGVERQVMCVTHLPQVAAFGHHHWQVAKAQEGETTVSRLSVLDREARINEIARMLGGQLMTDATRATASEMLAVAHN